MDNSSGRKFSFRGLVFVLIGLAVVFLYLGNRYLTSRQDEITVTETQREPLDCDNAYIDIKTAVIDSLKEGEVVCGLTIGAGNAITVPNIIEQLPDLQELDVSNNRIENLPDWIGAFSDMRELNLSNNRLGSLPQEIGSLQNLRILDLRNNPMTEKEIEAVKTLLPRTKIYSNPFFEGAL